MHYLTVTARDQCDDDGNRCRCELDEFPLDSLREAGVLPQALRMLNGNENGRQGRDYQTGWKQYGSHVVRYFSAHRRSPGKLVQSRRMMLALPRMLSLLNME